jgi:lipopolysaccharide transport system permease protein
MGNVSPRTVITANPESLHRLFSPIRMTNNIWRNRNLISQMTWREIASRYKGSYLGMLWSLINPLLLLVIFTFVFSVVFKAKWGISVSENRVEFALALFCGLLIFNVFSESINRAPGLILTNQNYVKKVIFPLEILPVTIVFSSFFHMLVSLGIFLLGVIIFMGTIHWTIVFFPLIAVSLLSLTLGLTWLLSSIGVFIRDVGYTVGFLTTALFFLTPIFYPISAVPTNFQIFIKLNPLSVIMENNRRILMWGHLPDWTWLFAVVLFSFVIMVLGYGFFMKSKRAFADVI